MVFEDNLSSDGRDVVSRVGFTGDEEIAALELREGLVETGEELPEIVGDLSFIVCEFIVADSAVASSYGLINVDDVRVVVPRVRVRKKSQVVLH